MEEILGLVVESIWCVYGRCVNVFRGSKRPDERNEERKKFHTLRPWRADEVDRIQDCNMDKMPCSSPASSSPAARTRQKHLRLSASLEGSKSRAYAFYMHIVGIIYIYLLFLSFCMSESTLPVKKRPLRDRESEQIIAQEPLQLLEEDTVLLEGTHLDSHSDKKLKPSKPSLLQGFALPQKPRIGAAFQARNLFKSYSSSLTFKWFIPQRS